MSAPSIFIYALVATMFSPSCHVDPFLCTTRAMFAVGYMDIGKYDAAYSNFVRGYANVQPPFMVWRETPTGGAVNFLTGAGGFVQSVLFGYGGVRLPTSAASASGSSSAGLQINPPPPPAALKLGNASAFTMHGLDYLGNSLRVRVTDALLQLEVLGTSARRHAQPPASLHVVDAHGKVLGDLSTGKQVEVRRQPVFICA
jgi:hypothetical protein